MSSSTEEKPPAAEPSAGEHTSDAAAESGLPVDGPANESTESGGTTYATPKPNRASAVFTAATVDEATSAAAPQEPDPKETIDSLQAQVKELESQLSGLNSKLVRSFERVADLEDDYSEVKSRLQSSQTKISDLEKERSEHLAALNTGLLVEKSHVSSEMQRMMDKVLEETKQRGKAESDKKQIEEELESLSASLFSEANRMVAVEKLARARAEEKSGSMEKSLKDTEGIMLEQQKVLASLQRQIEELQQGGLSSDAASAKSSPDHILSIESLARSPSMRTTKATAGSQVGRAIEPGMQLLINIQPFQEFIAFIGHLRKSRLSLKQFYTFPVPGQGAPSAAVSPKPPSRTSSPSPFAALAAAAGGSGQASAQALSHSGSSSSLNPFQAAGVSRHRDYPSLPSSAEDLVKPSNQLSLPFLKRTQEEDSDPCLRLDFAPGLNWLTRRQANTAILDGTLVIEPIFPGGVVPDADEVRAQNAHLPPAACSMCGMLVVNVPIGGPNAPHADTAEATSPGTRSSSWANSFSAAGSSMLEAAGVSRQKTEEQPAAAAGAQDAAATKSSRPSLFSSLRMGTSSPKPDRGTPSIAQRLPSFGLTSSASVHDSDEVGLVLISCQLMHSR